MFVGDNRHYRIHEIKGTHFIQTAERAGLPGSIASDALVEIAQAAGTAMKTIEKQLPSGFPEEIHASVNKALAAAFKNLNCLRRAFAPWRPGVKNLPRRTGRAAFTHSARSQMCVVQTDHGGRQEKDGRRQRALLTPRLERLKARKQTEGQAEQQRTDAAEAKIPQHPPLRGIGHGCQKGQDAENQQHRIAAEHQPEI